MDPKLEPDTTQDYLFWLIDKEAGLKTKPLEKLFDPVKKAYEGRMLELIIWQKCCRVLDVNWIDITKFGKVSQFESILPKRIQAADNARDKDASIPSNIQ